MTDTENPSLVVKADEVVQDEAVPAAVAEAVKADEAAVEPTIVTTAMPPVTEDLPPKDEQVNDDEAAVEEAVPEETKVDEVETEAAKEETAVDPPVEEPKTGDDVIPPEQQQDAKRKREEEEPTEEADNAAKKQKTEDLQEPAPTPADTAAAEAPPPPADTGDQGEAKPEGGEAKDEAPRPEPAPVGPSKEGTTIFNDHDVLSGRGGGTNVHPGNRNFRDLINLHRRAYLKARKNDKPAISRAIVRSVRENNGRFLKKDEKSGLWFEIGDDAAREKTSQALRQRAPEMRKLLFDTEREEARAAAEEQMRQHQRMMMGMPPEMLAQMQNMPPHPGMPPMGPGGVPMFPNPAMMAQMSKNMPPGQDPYSQMFAMMGPMGRFPPPPPPNGPPAPQQQQQPANGGITAEAAAAPAVTNGNNNNEAVPAPVGTEEAAAPPPAETTEPAEQPEAKPEPTAQATV